MKTLKRLFVSVKSQIDTAADHLENHEALAGAAIRDLQSIGAKTSIHLRHLQNLQKELQEKLDASQEQAELWSGRAVTARKTDEQRALACARRVQQARRQIARLEKQLQETQDMTGKVKADLENIRIKLQDLKKRKELLAARQNRAEIMSVLEQQGDFSGTDIQDVFERWENNVVGAEFQYQDSPEQDDLAAEFVQQEEDEELHALLDELTSPAPDDKSTTTTGEKS